GSHFPPKESALERMDAFNGDKAGKPEERHHGLTHPLTGRGLPAQYSFDMLPRKIVSPGLMVGGLPLRLGHSLVSGRDMLQIILVEIRVHPDPAQGEIAVIFASWKRGEKEKFQKVDRELFFDDLDIARDGFRGIRGEAQYVSHVGLAAGRFLPRLQHAPVFPDLILP